MLKQSLKHSPCGTVVVHNYMYSYVKRFELVGKIKVVPYGLRNYDSIIVVVFRLLQ